MAGLAVPISSRKIVPPSACMNLPILSPVAPVNEPATWPNSSLSSSVSGSAPQATSTNGLSRRPLRRWMARAIIDLPVPLSPVTSTVALVSATLSIMSKTSQHAVIVADDVFHAEPQIELGLEVLVFFEHFALIQCPLDGHFQFFVDQRLGEEIERAGANRFDRRFDRAVAGDQDHRRGGVAARGHWPSSSKPSPSPRRMSASTQVVRLAIERGHAR